MAVTLHDFLVVAAKDSDDRLTLDSNQTRIQVNPSTAFTRGQTIRNQNAAIRLLLHQLIANSNEYGLAVAQQVFPIGVNDNLPLSSRTVNRTLQLLGERKLLAVCENLISQDWGNFGPRTTFKLRIRVLRAIVEAKANFYYLLGDWRGNTAAAIVASYKRTGQLKIDQDVALADGQHPAVCTIVDTAINNLTHAHQNRVRFKDLPRATLYHSFLRDGLLAFLEGAWNDVMRVLGGRNNRTNVLGQLGSHLARVIDEHVGYAVFDHFKASGDLGNYAQRIQELDAQDFFAEYMGTYQAVEQELFFFVLTFSQLMKRLARDQHDIATTFFNGGNIALEKITVTGSDPHHGGQRVIILDFGNNNKVVYKPRDCRVDAKITGTANVGGNGTSVASLCNQLLGRNAVTTYRYLLRGQDNGEYGYVQFLPHEDNDYKLLNAMHAISFFRDFGALGAISYLVGATDLHQGNVIVSGRRPYLTDLEIAFSQSVLGNPLRGEKDSSLGSIGFDRALSSSSEREFILPFSVQNDRIVERDNSESSETANFVTLNGQRLTVHQHQPYRTAFRDAYLEIMKLFEDSNNNKALVKLLDEFSGMHVRFHPIATMSQLQMLTSMKNNPRAKKEMIKLNLGEGIDANLGGVLPEKLCNVVRADLRVGDVAYFTRQLGDGKGIFHHDALGSASVDVAGYDGLKAAKLRAQYLTLSSYQQRMIAALDKLVKP